MWNGYPARSVASECFAYRCVACHSGRSCHQNCWSGKGARLPSGLSGRRTSRLAFLIEHSPSGDSALTLPASARWPEQAFVPVSVWNPFPRVAPPTALTLLQFRNGVDAWSNAQTVSSVARVLISLTRCYCHGHHAYTGLPAVYSS